jgi:hypothetical protein
VARYAPDDVNGLTFYRGGEDSVARLQLSESSEHPPVGGVATDDPGIARFAEPCRSGDVAGTRNGLTRADALHHGLVD